MAGQSIESRLRRALEPPHTLHAADCKAWLSADFDPDETLSFPKPQWMDFMVRSAALPLVQADQMRGSGGPNACGRPTSFYLKKSRQELGTSECGVRTWNVVGLSGAADHRKRQVSALGSAHSAPGASALSSCSPCVLAASPGTRSSAVLRAPVSDVYRHV